MQLQRKTVFSLSGVAILLAGWVFLAVPLLCITDMLSYPCECCTGDGGSHHGGCGHDPCSQNAIRAGSSHRIPLTTGLFFNAHSHLPLIPEAAPSGRPLVSAFDANLSEALYSCTPLLI